MAASNNQTGNQTKRSDIAAQLFEAYSALSCCSLSEQLIAEALLPGLRCLLLDMEALGEAHMQEVVSAMVRDYQSRLEARSQAPLSTDDLKATVMSRIKDTNISNIFTRKK
ncbi:LisH domain and HEAT repeat-containing protein KIAA1468 homolog [Elysia marginata]|uniref:LisH domain and HEAT repeat-containing protein KIAA1468 homolog n=1 Tax=Elysia marginata TaxID=1093978 RepID=A0AAV4HNV0_9GAST|nr:LisH domain and HEAT repeat-containing protein KIAA1468 homolog [Elysia marginata]